MNYEVTIIADNCIIETYEVDADSPQEAEVVALDHFEAEYGDPSQFTEFNLEVIDG